MAAQYGSIIVYLLSHTSDGLKSENVPNLPLDKKRHVDGREYSK